MSTVSDFTASQIDLVRSLIQARYHQDIDLHLADAELRLNPDSSTMTSCPTLFWGARDASFVIFKTPGERFRCQFFYSTNDHYGTGKDEYDNLEECVTTLLQVQADHENQREESK
ncbi:MAG TPA: hypothetical protein QF550_00070 [Arenicellales bacterium]|jgi:hypothetical protein|nr:hypothetical protein [Arenicellales bacterium]HJP25700.1 hypothetical protein [Arenicellales bacterium]|tara:strand:+ start:247 stop:591 length:345 start_codon:yes stop_codon:yes gene_type:complete